MTGQEALSLLIGILEQEKLPYMIVGSFSSNYHGIPRSTKDADIVLQFDPVIQKLRWAKGGLRSKDFEDVVNVLIRKGEDLDCPHIEHWCGIHGTLELLEQARSVAGE